MANEKELPQEMLKALEPHQLGDVSGGMILHRKKDEKDEWFVVPDPERRNDFGPFGPIGIKIKQYGEFSGPYESEQEAIEAAKNLGCTNTNVFEWEAFNEAARNQN